MAKRDIIWKAGDAWRDLTDDVRAAGTATAISLHGTARYIDAEHGRQARFPTMKAGVFACDGHWLPLGDWSLTPCGLVTEAPDHWSRGTPLRLVLAGFVEGWASTPIGVETLAAVHASSEPTAPGHPASRAGPTGAHSALLRSGGHGPSPAPAVSTDAGLAA